MRKAFTMLRFGATVMAMICCGLWAWGLFFEKPFLTYENLPFPPVLEKVAAGEVMPLIVRRCSSSKTVRFYDVTHELLSLDDPSAKPLIMVGERVKIAPGCHEGLSTVNRVPNGTRAGRYVASGLGIVDGSVRTFAIPWNSQPFEVTR